MELATFLTSRAWRWDDVKDWWRCVDSWAWAASLVPENVHYQNGLKRAMVAWDKHQKSLKPPGFPPIIVKVQRRLFPDSLPVDLEQDIFGLTATHHMLTDPRLEEKYWGRMRRSDYTRTPAQATAIFSPDERCDITLTVS